MPEATGTLFSGSTHTHMHLNPKLVE